MTKDQDIKAWNDGAFPASSGAVLIQGMPWREYMRSIEDGNTEPTMDELRQICRLAREAIEAPPQTASNEAMVALAGEIEKLKNAFEWNAFCQSNRKRISEAIRLAAAAPEVGVREALALAVSHLDHMAAWITEANCGRRVGIYSFESLGEDMPGIRATLSRPPRPDATAGREEIARIIEPLAFDPSHEVRHRFCSPMAVKYIQEKIFAKADAILALFNPETARGDSTGLSSADRGM